MTSQDFRDAIAKMAAIDGLSNHDLHLIAAGPIMDPCRLYLPMGRISLAEAKARERALVERLA